MSNIIYDFLTESFLFNDTYLNDEFIQFSNKQIEKELLAYREYVLKNIDGIVDETKKKNNQLSVSKEFITSNMVDINVLKQCSLYVHKFILNDPLFSFTSGINKSDMNKVMSEYFGNTREEIIDRVELCKIIYYMRTLTAGIVTGYIKFVPGSYMHEAPEKLPITYSENYFSDVREKYVLDYFHNNIEVIPGYAEHNGGIILYPEKKLEPCRVIGINIKNHSEAHQPFFILFENEIVSYDEATRKIIFRQSLPKEPPEYEYFNKWVYQSINQVANSLCSQLENDIILSTKLNTMYLTESEFVHNLLKLSFNEQNDPLKSLQANTFNSMIDVSLPIIEKATLGEVLAVRDKDGEVFENFRNEFARKIVDLQYIKDTDELKRKTQDIVNELCEIQVNEIDRKIKKLRSKFFRDSAILFGGLVGTVVTNNSGCLLSSAVAIGQGFNSYIDYKNQVKENPAYLLWRIQRSIRK